MPRPAYEPWATHPLIQREAAAYTKLCPCQQRIEAGRAELHRTLESVLVIDMRMNWNGIGNSLTRWLAVLRLGTATGRATFLWLSDRPLQAGAKPGGKPLNRIPVPGRRLKQFRLDPWKRPHSVQRPQGFDLGDYFVAVDADYRWSRAQYRRVAASMASRNVSSPLLVNYRCVKHTWACMQPMLEYGPLGDPVWQNDPGALDGGFGQPPNRVNCTHEQEKDGFLVSWLSSRTEPWLLLRLNEQTALEPSGPAAAAVLSGAWPGPGISASAVPDTATAGAAPPPFWHGRRYATHACGSCLSTRLDLLSRLRAVQKKGPAASSGDDCVVDKHGSRGVWRPSNRPTDPKELAAYQAVAQLPYARGMRSLRRLRRGPRNIAFATACEAYSVLRPRRWLQRAMLPLLQKLTTATGGGPLIGVHLRSGFADWQWYSSTHIRAGVGANGVKANRQWEQALNAGPLSYDKHWKAFEAMLYDCKESVTNDGRPCFNWRTPHFGKAPDLNDAAQCAVERLKAANPSTLLPAKKGGGSSSQKHQLCLDVTPKSSCLWSLPMPSNGTLAAVVECSHRFATALADPKTSRDVWGLFVMGDAPGFGSLLHSLPALHGKVVHTNDAGGVAHTTFTGSCPHASTSCVHRGTVDPQGGWTRAMIDYYIGGLTDGFVSSLFSSFVGAVLRRSLTCCNERFHFGAMYSQQRSHRDKPMRNIDFLRALMQAKEQSAEEARWE